jgi:hypothetical protein
MQASIPAKRLTSAPIINQQSEHGKAADACEGMQWRLARSEILSRHAQTEDLGVRTHCEKGAAQKRTLNDGARNSLQRVARLGSQSRGTLKPDKTEQCQH